MAKRLTDTDKWKKKFLRGMRAPYKLLWFYILDECDHAGIWEVDFDVAEIRIGEEICEEQAKQAFKEKIYIFDDGKKWFIPDFIGFQYADELDPTNRVHKSVISRLNKYGLYEVFIQNQRIEDKPLISPLIGAKDKDMDKEKAKDKEKDPVFDRNFNQLEAFNEIWEIYPAKGRLKRSASLRVWCEIVISRDIASRIRTALDNYTAHLKANSDWAKQPKELSNWLNEWPDWEDHQEPEKEETDAERDARILAKYKK